MRTPSENNSIVFSFVPRLFAVVRYAAVAILCGMLYEPIVARIAPLFEAAFEELLSKKHIYQSVKLDAAAFLEVLRAADPSLSDSQAAKYFEEHMNAIWLPVNLPSLIPENDMFSAVKEDVGRFRLPIIKIACVAKCERVEPFAATGATVEVDEKRGTGEWHHLRYLCQGCLKNEVRFLVRRAFDKFTLTGRDPFQEVDVPKVIPKAHAKRFRDALVASNGGQPLAANFLLRVFVEQYWKSVPAVDSAIRLRTRPTGDELGEAYKATLPTEFKDRFPTLAEVYSDLSADMHNATGDPKVFEKSVAAIEEHFDARRLFKLEGLVTAPR